MILDTNYVGSLVERDPGALSLSREVDGVDSIVAAHGLMLNEPVVSNDADFQDVNGLDVVTY